MVRRHRVVTPGLAVALVVIVVLAVLALARQHVADAAAACVKRVLVSQGVDANQAALRAYPAQYNGPDPNAPSVGDIDYAMLMCNTSSP